MAKSAQKTQEGLFIASLDSTLHVVRGVLTINPKGKHCAKSMFPNIKDTVCTIDCSEGNCRGLLTL